MNNIKLYSDLDQDLNESIISGVEPIFQSISNIIMTRIGERLFNPEFGSRVPDLLFELFSEELAFEIFNEVINAIARWEPRATLILNQSYVTLDQDYHVFRMKLVFQVKGLSEDQFEISGDLENQKLG